MPDERNTSQHGTVVAIEEGLVKVKIIQTSACHQCQAQAHCPLTEQKEKIIEIEHPDCAVQLNEEVLISFQESKGWLAVLFSYIIPFLLVLFTLVMGLWMWDDEIKSGLSSLLILAPYYLIIYLFRDHLKKEFQFRMTKLQD